MRQSSLKIFAKWVRQQVLGLWTNGFESLKIRSYKLKSFTLIPCARGWKKSMSLSWLIEKMRGYLKRGWILCVGVSKDFSSALWTPFISKQPPKKCNAKAIILHSKSSSNLRLFSKPVISQFSEGKKKFFLSIPLFSKGSVLFVWHDLEDAFVSNE